MEIQLGNKVKDLVTGLTGIVTGKALYLNGCVQWHVKPPLDKDKKSVEGEWIDSAQLVYVNDGINIKLKKTGGPCKYSPKKFGMSRL